MVQKGKHKFPLWLILGIAMAFFLRMPSLLEPYSYGDECIYLTLGHAIKRGLLLYRDIHDNKPPLLYLLAAFSGNLFWFRTILLFSGLLTIFLFFLLAKRFFPKDEKMVKISTLIFSFLSSIPLFEAGVANAENFMILPVILGIILIFPFRNQSKLIFFISGLLFSISFLFKVPAAFDFAAIFLFIFLFNFSKRNWANFLNSLIFSFGFLFPIFLTFIFFWSKNALKYYLSAFFFQNVSYVSSWGSTPYPRLILLFLFTFFLFLKRKKIEESLLFLLLWFSFSLFGATLSGRPYPHYLIQVLPSFSLLLSSLLIKKKPTEHLLLSFSLALFLFSFFYFQFWIYSPIEPYKKFAKATFKKDFGESYLSAFGQKIKRNYEISKFLILSTSKNERVFIWGDSACIYALSGRLPLGRYTVSYHIIDFNGFAETISLIKEKKPKFIIDLQDEPKPFPELKKILEENYFLFNSFDEAKVYHKKIPPLY